MLNKFKKNQIIIFALGLMIITAGYLSYSNNINNNLIETSAIADSEEMASIGDAKLVSANVAEENNVISNNISSTSNTDSNVINENSVDSNLVNDLNGTTNSVDSVIASSLSIESSDDYFSSSRLERNKMYSQQIENYQDILNNTNVSEAQKKTAQEEITKLNSEQNGIMISENIIKTKGIEDLVIFVNNESINVIVKGKEIEKEEIAQIQNIVTRELEADIGNIHIMNKE